MFSGAFGPRPLPLSQAPRSGELSPPPKGEGNSAAEQAALTGPPRTLPANDLHPRPLPQKERGIQTEQAELTEPPRTLPANDPHPWPLPQKERGTPPPNKPN